MRLTVKPNELEEECCEEPAAASNADREPTKKLKKNNELPAEETPAQQTPLKKKRKLTDSTESPGKG